MIGLQSIQDAGYPVVGQHPAWGNSNSSSCGMLIKRRELI